MGGHNSGRTLVIVWALESSEIVKLNVNNFEEVLKSSLLFDDLSWKCRELTVYLVKYNNAAKYYFELPSELKGEMSPDVFKSNLKTHLWDLIMDPG